jgi:iron-sulfur cluster assembly accessory protein
MDARRIFEGRAALTVAAEQFIRRMMRFAPGATAGFRMRVSPGGCSGLSVTFDLASEQGQNEALWTPSGLRIFFDPASSLLLDGAVVDFVETRSHTGFTVTIKATAGQSCSQDATLVPIGSLVRG